MTLQSQFQCQKGHGPVISSFPSSQEEKDMTLQSQFQCQKSHGPVIPRSQVPKKKKEIPLGFVPVASPQKSRREKGALQFQDPPPKEPLWNPRKKEKICWKCSRTFSFNDKWFCLLKLVCCFFNFKENQDSLPRKSPWKSLRTLLVRSHHQDFPLMSLQNLLPYLLPCHVTVPCFRAMKGREKETWRKSKEEGRTCQKDSWSTRRATKAVEKAATKTEEI